jgi:hypothetical protein
MRNHAAIVLPFLLAVPSVRAQFSSAITGLVTDDSGGVIVNARVETVNLSTNVVRGVDTSRDGMYRIMNLPPGAYQVRAASPGFRTGEFDKVALAIQETIRLDFVLQVGSVSEKVSVTAEQTGVETEEARVTDRIEQELIRELPLVGRNIYTILSYQPGVTGRYTASTPGSGGAWTDSYSSESQIMINASGQRSESNAFSVDDTSVVNDVGRGGVTHLTPNPESVAEMRVTTNNMSATEGRTSGARLQVVTKSGSNAFHGSGAYFFQNDTLGCRNIFETAPSLLPDFHRHEFAWGIGGPIVRNKTFFFTSYQGLRQAGGRARLFSAETKDFRDFAASRYPNSIGAGLLRDFPVAVYPTEGLRDLGSPRAGFVPGPADGVMDVGILRFSPAQSRDGDQFSVRIDHELRPGRDRIYANYYRTSAHTLNGGARPAFDSEFYEVTHFGNLNYTYTFGPAVLNEFRLGIMKAYGLPPMPTRLDIPEINLPEIPKFSTSYYPGGFWGDAYEFKDTLSWVRAGHTLKIGGEVRPNGGNTINSFGYIPIYQFSSMLSFPLDEALATARLVDPRDGTPSTIDGGLRAVEWAVYVQDDWKVSRDLTLSLGLRYEDFGSQNWDQNSLRNLIYGQGSNIWERVAAGRVDFVSRFYPRDLNNFAPRLGFAWNPGGKGRRAIRGGYGIGYDRLQWGNIAGYLSNPPSRAAATLSPLYGTRFTYSLGDPSKPYLGYPVDPGLKLGLDANNGIKGARVALTAVDPALRTPMVHNWFFGYQETLGWGLVAEVNYLASAGRHLYDFSDVNRYRGDLKDNRLDRFNPSFADVNLLRSQASSIFHGMSASVRRRYSKGLTLQASYSLGKAITNADQSFNVTNYVDISDLRIERAVAGFDVTHKFSVVGVWEMPFLRSARSAAGRFLSGWVLSGIGIFQGGFPFTVFHGGSWPAGDFNQDGKSGDRPNAPAAGVPRGGWERSDYQEGLFRASDFPVPAAGTNGNLGRNTFRGPGFAQLDLTISKAFRLSEGISLQLRAEAFNALNRVNLQNPVSNLVSPDFGRSTSTLSPRQFQIGGRISF